MKKEFYRHALPHFQQSGQAYFITWSLKDAVPKKALKRYTDELEKLRLQIKSYGAAGDTGAADSAEGIHSGDPLINRMSGSESAPPKMSDSEIAPPARGKPRHPKFALFCFRYLVFVCCFPVNICQQKYM
jgi:hypothetical protein